MYQLSPSGCLTVCAWASSLRLHPNDEERILTRGARARDLKRLFGGLGVPASSHGRVYETARIAQNSRYRVGRDHQGNPAILIETTGASGAAGLSDFEGQHLRVGHGVTCSISEADVEVGREQFSVVTCIDSDDLLKDRFFDAAETLIRSLGETPVSDDLRQMVAGLIELFRLASQPPKGTIQGLWAELWLITQARDPEILLNAWHAESRGAYDFNSGPERLEVKSTSQRIRKHTFSHRQLQPPTGTRVVIASVFVESSGGGPTISTLVERIRRRVAKPQLFTRLDHVVASTLGANWRAGVEATFDSELASESLRFYKAEAVPSLPSDIPPGVSDIRYVSDLSQTPILVGEDMLGNGELFAAVASMDP